MNSFYFNYWKIASKGTDKYTNELLICVQQMYQNRIKELQMELNQSREEISKLVSIFHINTFFY